MTGQPLVSCVMPTANRRAFVPLVLSRQQRGKIRQVSQVLFESDPRVPWWPGIANSGDRI